MYHAVKAAAGFPLHQRKGYQLQAAESDVILADRSCAACIASGRCRGVGGTPWWAGAVWIVVHNVVIWLMVLKAVTVVTHQCSNFSKQYFAVVSTCFNQLTG